MNKIKIFISSTILILFFSVFHEIYGAAQDDIYNIPGHYREMSPQSLKKIAIPFENGDKTAQFLLGELSSASQQKQKKIEAQNWWRAAALQQHEGALERLINYKRKGLKTVFEEDEEICKKFRKENKKEFKKSERGDLEASLNIGNFYETGFVFQDGTEMGSNIDKAIEYWIISARGYNKDAIEKIYNLNISTIEK
jgi:TPR repeat protein